MKSPFIVTLISICDNVSHQNYHAIQTGHRMAQWSDLPLPVGQKQAPEAAEVQLRTVNSGFFSSLAQSMEQFHCLLPQSNLHCILLFASNMEGFEPQKWPKCPTSPRSWNVCAATTPTSHQFKVCPQKSAAKLSDCPAPSFISTAKQLGASHVAVLTESPSSTGLPRITDLLQNWHHLSVMVLLLHTTSCSHWSTAHSREVQPCLSHAYGARVVRVMLLQDVPDHLVSLVYFHVFCQIPRDMYSNQIHPWTGALQEQLPKTRQSCALRDPILVDGLNLNFPLVPPTHARELCACKQWSLGGPVEPRYSPARCPSMKDRDQGSTRTWSSTCWIFCFGHMKPNQLRMAGRSWLNFLMLT